MGTESTLDIRECTEETHHKSSRIADEVPDSYFELQVT